VLGFMAWGGRGIVLRRLVCGRTGKIRWVRIWWPEAFEWENCDVGGFFGALGRCRVRVVCTGWRKNVEELLGGGRTLRVQVGGCCVGQGLLNTEELRRWGICGTKALELWKTEAGR